MAVANESPHCLLLGGGYTLQRLAAIMPKGSFVITSRSRERCAAWISQGWFAETLSIDDSERLAQILGRYPSIKVIVDSVPPLREGDPVRGVSSVVSCVQSSQISRLLYLSTTGVYGVLDGSVVDESTPCNPHSPGGRARKSSEDLYRSLSRTCNVTVLRLPAIYNFDRGLRSAICSGRYRIIGDGSQWTNRIHVDDLVEIIRLSITFPGILPDVLCVSDDSKATASEVAAFICEREGLPMPESITREEAIAQGLHTMLSNQRVDNSLMKRILGVALRYPSYREGFFSDLQTKP